jgi:hypothetical protein
MHLTWNQQPTFFQADALSFQDWKVEHVLAGETYINNQYKVSKLNKD